jgi:hypothetical protein
MSAVPHLRSTVYFHAKSHMCHVYVPQRRYRNSPFKDGPLLLNGDVQLIYFMYRPKNLQKSRCNVKNCRKNVGGVHFKLAFRKVLSAVFEITTLEFFTSIIRSNFGYQICSFAIIVNVLTSKSHGLYVMRLANFLHHSKPQMGNLASEGLLHRNISI